MAGSASEPPTVLLIVPPCWSVFAPHLAAPLLAGSLRGSSIHAVVHDANLALYDWLLSSVCQEDLLGLIGRNVDQALELRARLVHTHVVEHIDRAKVILREAGSLVDAQSLAWARAVVRNAFWCVSSAFEGLTVNFDSIKLAFSERSTNSVLQAIHDSQRNLYAWALDKLLPAAVIGRAGTVAVGISVSASTQLIAAMTIACHFKATHPDVRVYVGGNYATRMVERWSGRHPFFEFVDAFVLGEGDDALPALISAQLSGDTCLAIPGVVTAESQTHPRMKRVALPLDKIAPPDFAHMRVAHYMVPHPVFPVFASRGCPWRCAFCTISATHGHFRRRSVERTVQDLRFMVLNYGAEFFAFIDEVVPAPLLRDLSLAIIEAGLSIFWHAETRFFEAIDDELSSLLYRAGCRRLEFGLESYNQRVLNLMRKRLCLADVQRVIDCVLGAGIAPHLFVIHGFPGETRTEADRTLQFVERVVAHAARDGARYASWGGSPFYLDESSAVGRQPGEFGVSVMEPSADEDLRLDRDYAVTLPAMTQMESREYAGTVATGSLAPGNVWFRRGTPVASQEPDEYAFLRVCLGAPTGDVRLRGRVPMSWDDSTRVTLCGTQMVVSRSGERTADFRSLAVYRGDLDSFLELECALSITEPLLPAQCSMRSLARHLSVHAVRWRGLGGASLAGALLRFGIYEIDTCDMGGVEGAAWAHEAGVLVRESATGSLLWSDVTGNQVRLGRLGYFIWELCTAAPRTARDLASAARELGLALCNTDPAGSDDPFESRMQSTCERLCALGMLYPVPANAQGYLPS